MEMGQSLPPSAVNSDASIDSGKELKLITRKMGTLKLALTLLYFQIQKNWAEPKRLLLSLR